LRWLEHARARVIELIDEAHLKTDTASGLSKLGCDARVDRRGRDRRAHTL
jgi:hypothetical protein